jgi:hypothetical protein
MAVPQLSVALEHVQRKFLDFFDIWTSDIPMSHEDMLQLFDFELRPYRLNDSI